MKTDILIVGSGCSGLYAALTFPRDKKILIITKSDVESCDSFLAQGGICVLKDENDYDSFFEDTMRAGHYENDKTSVDLMIRSSRDVINELISYQVDFQRDAQGNLTYTKEGAHAHKRILFHADITGREITSKLLAAARARDNIAILEHTTLLDIMEENGVCYGGIVELSDQSIAKIEADFTMLATGGIGGLYKHSTNFRHLTGDALAIAIKHGIELKDVNYVQIHPTTLYSKDPQERSFLISESVRGEGAHLYDKNGKRFVNELLPRDVVSQAIFEQMKKDHTEFVWEDLRTIPREEVESHFPNIVEKCKKMGYDVFKECIPVVPAQHYFMGGIKVDYESKTSMEQLYAIGETACNGVHGRNRLASNSLLESLVFAKRAALHIMENYEKVQRDEKFVEEFPLDAYFQIDVLEQTYQNLVKDAIDQANQKEQEK